MGQHRHRIAADQAGQPVVQTAKRLVAQVEVGRRVERGEKELRQGREARLGLEVGIVGAQQVGLEGLQLSLQRRDRPIGLRSRSLRRAQQSPAQHAPQGRALLWSLISHVRIHAHPQSTKATHHFAAGPATDRAHSASSSTWQL